MFNEDAMPMQRRCNADANEDAMPWMAMIFVGQNFFSQYDKITDWGKKKNNEKLGISAIQPVRPQNFLSKEKKLESRRFQPCK